MFQNQIENAILGKNVKRITFVKNDNGNDVKGKKSENTIQFRILEY